MANRLQNKNHIESLSKKGDLQVLKEGVVDDRIAGLKEGVETVEENIKLKEMKTPEEFDALEKDTSDTVHIVMSSPTWCVNCGTFKKHKIQAMQDFASTEYDIVFHRYKSDKNEALHSHISSRFPVEGLTYSYGFTFPEFGFIQKGKVIGGNSGSGLTANEFLDKVDAAVKGGNAYPLIDTSLKTPGIETISEGDYEEMKNSASYKNMLADSNNTPQILLKYNDTNKDTIIARAQKYQERAGDAVQVRILSQEDIMNIGLDDLKHNEVLSYSMGKVSFSQDAEYDVSKEDFLGKIVATDDTPPEETEVLTETMYREMTSLEDEQEMLRESSDIPQIILTYTAANKSNILNRAEKYQKWAGDDAQMWVIDKSVTGAGGLGNALLEGNSVVSYAGKEHAFIRPQDYDVDKTTFLSDMELPSYEGNTVAEGGLKIGGEGDSSVEIIEDPLYTEILTQYALDALILQDSKSKPQILFKYTAETKDDMKRRAQEFQKKNGDKAQASIVDKKLLSDLGWTTVDDSDVVSYWKGVFMNRTNNDPSGEDKLMEDIMTKIEIHGGGTDATGSVIPVVVPPTNTDTASTITPPPERIEEAPEALTRDADAEKYRNWQIQDESVYKYLGAGSEGFEHSDYIPDPLPDCENTSVLHFVPGMKLRKNAYDSLNALAQQVYTQTGKKNNIEINLAYDLYEDGKISYDHQSGLSVDIYNFMPIFMAGGRKENSKYIAQFEKRKELATSHGFIQNRPGDQGHWRYVGKKLAQRLQDKNMSFAQYHAAILSQAVDNKRVSANRKVRIYENMSDDEITKLKESKATGRTILLLDKDDEETLKKFYEDYDGQDKLIIVRVQLKEGETSQQINADGEITALPDDVAVDTIGLGSRVQYIEGLTYEQIQERMRDIPADEHVMICLGSKKDRMTRWLDFSFKPNKKTTIFLTSLEDHEIKFGSAVDNIGLRQQDGSMKNFVIPQSEYDRLKTLDGTKRDNVYVYDSGLIVYGVDKQTKNLINNIPSNEKVITLPRVYEDRLDDIIAAYQGISKLHIVIKDIDDDSGSEILTKSDIIQIPADHQDPVEYIINKLKKPEIVEGLSEERIAAIIAANDVQKKRLILVPSANKDEIEELIKEYKGSVPLTIIFTDATRGYYDQNSTPLDLDPAGITALLDTIAAEVPTPPVVVVVPVPGGTPDATTGPDDDDTVDTPGGAIVKKLPNIDILSNPGLRSQVETKGSVDIHTATYSKDGRRIYITDDHTNTKTAIQRHQTKYDAVRTPGGSVEEDIWHNGQKAKITIRNDSGEITVSLDFGETIYEKVSGGFDSTKPLNPALHAGGRMIRGYSTAIHAADSSIISPDNVDLLSGLDDDYEGLAMQYNEERGIFTLGLDKSILSGQVGFDQVYIGLDPKTMPYGERVEFKDAVHGHTVKAMLQLDASGYLGVRIDTSSTVFLDAVKNDAESLKKKIAELIPDDIPIIGGGGGGKDGGKDKKGEKEDDETIANGKIDLVKPIDYKGISIKGFHESVKLITTESNMLALELKADETTTPTSFIIENSINVDQGKFSLDQLDDNGEIILDYPILNLVKRYQGYKQKVKMTIDPQGYMIVTVTPVLTGVDPLDGNTSDLDTAERIGGVEIKSVATRVACDIVGYERSYKVVKDAGKLNFVYKDGAKHVMLPIDLQKFHDGTNWVPQTITIGGKEVIVSVDSISSAGLLTLQATHESAPEPVPIPGTVESAELLKDSGWINPWFDSSKLDPIFNNPARLMKKNGKRETIAERDKRLKTRYDEFKRQSLRAMPATARKEVIDFVTSKEYLTASAPDRMVMAARFVAKMNHKYELWQANGSKDVVCRDSIVLIAELGGGFDIYKDIGGYPNGHEGGKRTAKILKLKNDPKVGDLKIGDRAHINDKGSDTDKGNKDNPEGDSHSGLITGIEEVAHGDLTFADGSVYTPTPGSTTYLIDEVSWKRNKSATTTKPDSEHGIHERKLLITDDPALVDHNSTGLAARMKYKGNKYNARSLKFVKRPSGRGRLPKRADVTKTSSTPTPAPDVIPTSPDRLFRESYDRSTKANIEAGQKKLRSMGYTMMGGVNGKKGAATDQALVFLEENEYKTTQEVAKEFIANMDTSDPYKSLFQKYFDVAPGKGLNAYGMKSVMQQIHDAMTAVKLKGKGMGPKSAGRFLALLVGENKEFHIISDFKTPIGQVFQGAWGDSKTALKNTFQLDIPGWTPANIVGPQTWYNQALACVGYMHVTKVFEKPYDGYIKYLLGPGVKAAWKDTPAKNKEYIDKLLPQAIRMKMSILKEIGDYKSSWETAKTKAEKKQRDTEVDTAISKLTRKDFKEIRIGVQKYYEQYM